MLTRLEQLLFMTLLMKHIFKRKMFLIQFMNVMVQRHVQLNLEVFQRMQDLREQDLDLRLFLKN